MKVYFNNSCKICRSEINMYKKENIEAIMNGEEIDELQVELNTGNNNERMQKHLEVFNIYGVYEHHKDYVTEIYTKAYIYNKEFRDDIKARANSIFNDNKRAGYAISDQDINNLILGNYTNDEDLNKRPLSKLTKDIAEELNLIPKPKPVTEINKKSI